MPFSRRFSPFTLDKIKVTDKFWAARLETLRSVGLLHQFRQIEETGRLENFRLAALRQNGGFTGRIFNDSDIYKWLEACAYCMPLGLTPELKGAMDEAIGLIVGAQQPNGYLNTYFQLEKPEMEFKNLSMLHEMYCAGHLFEAAVALYDSTGGKDHRLLDVAIRFADLIGDTFGPESRMGYPGHEEIELALIKLARATGRNKYRDLAKFFVESRGMRPSPLEEEYKDPDAAELSKYGWAVLTKDGKYTGEYLQDHLPIRQHDRVVGHAVRAMYFYMAAVDLAEGANDEELETAILRAWGNLTTQRMYVTGGIGPSGDNEGFTEDYDLPNLTAYAETCAACGLVWWGARLGAQTGSSDFTDIAERALYNGALAGISLSGSEYFYDNPLESRGTHKRTPWFDCACCPPNIARLIASVSSFAVGASQDALWIHMPIGFEVKAEFHGVSVDLKLEGDYPWSGVFSLSLNPAKPVEFEVRVRIPDWAEEISTEVPGLEEPAEYEQGYAVFKKVWSPGDTITIDLGIAPRWVQANPFVLDDVGRVSLARGPLVYCAEQIDLGYLPQHLIVDPEAETTEDKEDVLGGIVAVDVVGYKELDSDTGELYSPYGSVQTESKGAKFIPYYAWNNRGPNSMQVWIRSL